MAAEQIQSRILSHLKSDQYRPTKPRGLAHELNLHEDERTTTRSATPCAS